MDGSARRLSASDRNVADSAAIMKSAVYVLALIQTPADADYTASTGWCRGPCSGQTMPKEDPMFLAAADPTDPTQLSEADCRGTRSRGCEG